MNEDNDSPWLLSDFVWACVIVVFILFGALVSGCGGGGDQEEPPVKVRPPHTEQPTCKSIPAEQREAECSNA